MTKNQALVDDDRWKMKGGAHKCPVPAPRVCPHCGGTGEIEITYAMISCDHCDGTGEIWE